ncbi:uncharacterized protein LOC127837969 [Dreissena polymorpha]|nr:uncharacterized protein LOC127837969 [Dreissena polymorpha]
MESVADASVLIYVINSACSDDVQENKLMQLCKQLQSETGMNNLNSFDSKYMMFVCNNWELVEKKERSDPGAGNRYWKEIVLKIQKYFPGISEHDQLYKLSTTEARRCRRSGTVMSDLFKKVHERLRALIRSSHKGKMQKHYRWLDSLLQHVQTHVLVRIQFANDGSKSNNEVKQGFEKLQRFVLESKKMKEDLKQQAYARCTHMVLLIETHLN